MSPGPYPTLASSTRLQEERHGRERTVEWGLVSGSYLPPPLTFNLEVRSYLEVRRDLGREMVLRGGPNEKAKAVAEKTSG